MTVEIERVIERLRVRGVCTDALSFEPRAGETLRRPAEEVLADWFADELEQQGRVVLELYGKAEVRNCGLGIADCGGME